MWSQAKVILKVGQVETHNRDHHHPGFFPSMQHEGKVDQLKNFSVGGTVE